ncbi:MAG: cytochrome bc1 complex Rieske iron-sulfur subunit [Pseudonocardiaceae bacterium]
MSGPERDRIPTGAELEEMTPRQLEQLGYRLDDLEIPDDRARWPISGTRAERRAERQVASWFALSALSGLAFVVIFIAWPWEYRPPEAEGYLLYSLYTPLIGVTFGLSILGLGVGAIAYAKKFLPEDVAIQQRHDGGSSELDRRTTAARLTEAGRTSGFARRSLIKRTAGIGAGVVGLATGVLALGGLLRNPWEQGAQSPLWTTGWASADGEPVYLRYQREEISLARPEDLAAGSITTVFPYKESWDEEHAHEAMRAADNPVMLIRLRPGTPVVKRKGQEDFNYGDFFAFSKICTHMGCPTSLYESQTDRLLCPCHQSQFLANEYARPIFGPATRSLPQLPISVDERGYFVATGGFIEAVGPAFWERRS